MKLKQETNESILLEDGRFYGLYKTFSQELKLIDSHTSQDKIIDSNLSAKEAFEKLDAMDEKDYATHFQDGQEKLFFMEDDTDA